MALAVRPAATDDEGRRDRPLVVLDRPRHLGNLGAAIRVAAAADAAGVIVVGEVDPWHPTAVRGAAGLQFALPCRRVDALTGVARRRIGFDAGGTPLAAGRVAPGAALVFGSERHGLTAATRGAMDDLVALPMRPGVSSLNLATAVAAALYTLAPPLTPPSA
jgi:TrmH family RNA methyltransferase